MTTSSSQSAHSASSGNAIKSGAYSDRILAGEDPQKLADMTQALIADYAVQTFTGKRLCSDLALVMFKQDRLERRLQHLCQSHLAKHSVRAEICRELGIDTLKTTSLPDWIFTGDPGMRDKSRWLSLVVGQAYHLHDNHSSSLMLQIQQVYPELWNFVTGKSSAKAKAYTFAEMLDQYSQQSDPRYRLKDLIDHITKTYSAELLWATKEERFEQVLASFVDQCMFDALTDPNFQRSVVFLERQQKELIQQLLALEAAPEPGNTQALNSSQGKVLQIRANTPKASPRASGQEPDATV
jgi:hypothetical protein